MFKNVTDNQGLGFARMARAKGISRKQLADAEEDGTIGRVLDAIRDGEPIITGPRIIPPTGGRIHTVKVRSLPLDREWQEAVSAAGPSTGRDWNIRRVGNLYLPTGTGVVEEEEHILLNYSDGGGSLDKALAWAAQFNLTPNDPRRVFAMAEQNQQLNRHLGLNPVHVVAPIACTFGGSQQTCDTWSYGVLRGASLRWTDGLGFARDWFSFRPLAQTGK